MFDKTKNFLNFKLVRGVTVGSALGYVITESARIDKVYHELDHKLEGITKELDQANQDYEEALKANPSDKSVESINKLYKSTLNTNLKRLIEIKNKIDGDVPFKYAIQTVNTVSEKHGDGAYLKKLDEKVAHLIKGVSEAKVTNGQEWKEVFSSDELKGLETSNIKTFQDKAFNSVGLEDPKKLVDESHKSVKELAATVISEAVIEIADLVVATSNSNDAYREESIEYGDKLLEGLKIVLENTAETAETVSREIEKGDQEIAQQISDNIVDPIVEKISNAAQNFANHFFKPPVDPQDPDQACDYNAKYGLNNY